MNLLTLKHGPQPDGSVRAGSLDILYTAGREDSLHTLIRPLRTMAGLAAHQVDSATDAEFPLKDLDLILMNPPFTSNTARNRQFGSKVARHMQQHELRIRDAVETGDESVKSVINANSVGTFLTPLAERLLDRERGCLAKVVPVTACVSASGLPERKYLASRFHIERIVTSHDPRRISFSENAGIHECLIVARRRQAAGRPPTDFVALRRMPATPEEALEAADAIIGGSSREWGRVTRWPEHRVRAGNWTPAQWFDAALADAALEIEKSAMFEPLLRRYEVGPAGRRIRDTYQAGDEHSAGALQLFWSISSDLRRFVGGHTGGVASTEVRQGGTRGPILG